MIRELRFIISSIIFSVLLSKIAFAEVYITDLLFRERFRLNTYDTIQRSLSKAMYDGTQLKGSFGKIYKIYDPYTEENVLIKISPLDDAKNWLNFYMESLGLNELEHPNLLKGYGSYLVNLDPISREVGIAHVMECLDADLYQSIVKHGPLKTSEIKKFLGPIVSALTYLATNQLVHFDIKPENILVRYKKGSDQRIEKLFIGDFGGLRMLTNKQSTVTQREHGLIMTPKYAPKEAFFKNHPQTSEKSTLIPKELNEKADVWSLGALLYVLSQHEHLIESGSSQPQIQLRDMKKKLVKKFSREDGGYLWRKEQIDRLDYGLFCLIDKMLRFNPEDRISMQEVDASNFFETDKTETEQMPVSLENYFKAWPDLNPKSFERLLLKLGQKWDHRIKSRGGRLVEL
ncbi:MAG: protein kinase [Oligoflexales bacterium]